MFREMILELKVLRWF